ncbi:MAG: ABC transporter substrate-binding protein [Devosia sp.]
MKLTRRKIGLFAGGACLASMSPSFGAEAQGISKDHILLGTTQDMSGPAVAVSKPFVWGMQLRLDQINTSGGINGRALRLQVEDHVYDPKKAVIATEKLLTSDKVFAIVGSMGSSTLLASMPLVLAKNIPYVFPLSSIRESFDPFNKYKFAMLVPFDTETRAGLIELISKKGYKKIAVLIQDEQWGLDILRATEGVLQEDKLQLAAKATYKRGATDFSSQAQRLKDANPDLIVVGTAVRETVSAVTALRQIGYAGDFMGTSASFHKDIPKMGGKPLEGFVTLSGFPMMYRDNPKNSAELNKWMDAYQAKFGQEPDQYSATGYLAIEMFAQALQKAGNNPTSDSLVAALEGLRYPSGFLGNSEYVFGPRKHDGAAAVRLSTIKDGRWEILSDKVQLR